MPGTSRGSRPHIVERAVHGDRVGIPHHGGDVADGVVGVDDQLFGALNAEFVQVIQEPHVEFGFQQVGEHRQADVEMFGHRARRKVDVLVIFPVCIG